ncbi:MAG: hypothetical protein R3F49_07870 [Planctomycetota bacterium]
MTRLVHTFLPLCALTLASLANGQASWHLLGDVPGGADWSNAYGVNGDGSVVSGFVSTSAGLEPSRWTVQGGHEPLGGPSAFTGIFGLGFGVSEDGSSVVGSYLVTTPSPPLPGFHWDRPSGVTLVPTLRPGDGTSAVNAVSADGSVGVGSSGSSFGSTGGPVPPPTHKAFRWTSATGPVFLGFLPGGQYSYANGVSADGNVIVGTSDTGGQSEAFLWTAAGGMSGLGTLPGATDSSGADVSSDGLVVVGGSGGEAFRWSAATGMQSLGPGVAIKVNRDGTVILGPDWLWTSASGRVALFPHLAALGAVLPAGGSLTANDLSADGNAVVGTWSPGGFAAEQGWVAYLAPPAFDLCPLLSADPFEPNDDCGSAFTVPSGTHVGLNVQASDPDFYSIALDVGSTLNVSAFFTHAEGDLDLFLYSTAGCAAAAPLASATTTTDDEVLQWQNTTGLPTVVVLEVRIATGANDECNTYDLVVATGPGSAIGTSYCGPAVNNATGQPGVLAVFGSDVAATNDVTLAADSLPPSGLGYFLASRSQDLVAMPGVSIGNLCLGAPVGRFDGAAQSSGATGRIVQAIDLTALPFAGGAQSAQAGESWNFQCWYRDSLVGLATSNFTDAVSVTFQ